MIIKKCQSSIEIITYVSFFLVIFIAGSSIYLTNINKISRNTAYEYAYSVLDSITNSLEIARVQSAEIITPLQPELPGLLPYKLELNKSGTDTLIITLITKNEGFAFQKIIKSRSSTETIELFENPTSTTSTNNISIEPTVVGGLNITSDVGSTTKIAIRGILR